MRLSALRTSDRPRVFRRLCTVAVSALIAYPFTCHTRERYKEIALTNYKWALVVALIGSGQLRAAEPTEGPMVPVADREPHVYEFDGKRLRDLKAGDTLTVGLGEYYIALPKKRTAAVFVATDDGRTQIEQSYYDPDRKQWIRRDEPIKGAEKAGFRSLGTQVLGLQPTYPAWRIRCSVVEGLAGENSRRRVVIFFPTLP